MSTADGRRMPAGWASRRHDSSPGLLYVGAESPSTAGNRISLFGRSGGTWLPVPRLSVGKPAHQRNAPHTFALGNGPSVFGWKIRVMVAYSKGIWCRGILLSGRGLAVAFQYTHSLCRRAEVGHLGAEPPYVASLLTIHPAPYPVGESCRVEFRGTRELLFTRAGSYRPVRASSFSGPRDSLHPQTCKPD